MPVLKRSRLAVTLALPILGAPPSYAQGESSRWIRVDRKPEIVIYVDRWRIDSVGEGLFHIWMKWELPAPMKEPSGKTIDRWLTHTVVDCRRFRSLDTELVYYLGEVLQATVPIPENLRQWVAPPPQSVGETTIVRGCLIAIRKPTDEVP